MHFEGIKKWFLPGGWHLYTTITIIISQCYDIYNLDSCLWEIWFYDSSLLCLKSWISLGYFKNPNCMVHTQGSFKFPLSPPQYPDYCELSVLWPTCFSFSKVLFIHQVFIHHTKWVMDTKHYEVDCKCTTAYYPPPAPFRLFMFLCLCSFLCCGISS